MSKLSDQINGLLLLDKPVGISSNQALSKAKRCLKSRKAGHAGTLDPFANGLLLCAFGQATKANAYLLKADKTYRAQLKLGIATATGDTEGETIQSSALPQLGLQQWQVLADQFIGQQQQTPPMYSALKHNGVPLYELARKGQVVERQSRSIVIHDLQVTTIDNDLLSFEVSCSTGTYVRTLAEDLAKAAGTVGHLQTLRRLSIGEFNVVNAVSLEQLDTAVSMQTPIDELLLPPEDALLHLPRVSLDVDQTAKFLFGQTLTLDSLSINSAELEGFQMNDLCRIFSPDHFLGVGVVVNGGLRTQRLFTRTGVDS